MEYYAAWKSKEILAHTAAWINFEGTMLSEIIQLQEDKHMYGWDLFLFTSTTALLTGYIPQYKIKSLKFGGVVKKKTNTIWFYLDEISQEVKIIEIQSRRGLGLEEGERKNCF